jgi:hypothetical protein
MSVDVDAVQCVLRRTWTHVCEKCLIRLNPRRMDLDSSSAVVLIAKRIRIQTPLRHRLPRVVLPWTSAASYGAVSGIAVAGQFILAATAANSAATMQAMRQHDRGVAAVTTAIPRRATAWPGGAGLSILRPADHNQPSEAMPSEIDRFVHFTILQGAT